MIRTRSDVQRALVGLLAPAERHFSAGRARVCLGYNSAHYASAFAEIEGFARLLWGVVPLVAGGYPHPSAHLFVEGIVNGTDPSHPEFWGVPADRDVRLIEAAVLGYALCLAPRVFWHPLSSQQRSQLATWIGHINGRKLYDNNWLFFRVLANIGLRHVGAPFDEARMRGDLARLDSFYRGDGWYRDGPAGPGDYYNSFVFHFDGLIVARACRDDERERAAIMVERARAFAGAFMPWFSNDGSSVPYGRSLVYRFAQAAFWSALAFGREEIVPWGVVKGLLLRHLRWWLARPILTETGTLGVGYAYPNAQIAEQYVSAGSPYWALKAFAALAADDDHPIWSSAEEPLPPLPARTLQKSVRMILCRDADHVVALAGGQPTHAAPRFGAEKYAKFCYSTHFGFGVPFAEPGLEFASPESTLLLSDDKEWLRGPRNPEAIEEADDRLVSRWRPWPDVAVTTWLVPHARWHVRVHRIVTARHLHSVEGGFAISRDEPGLSEDDLRREAAPGHALAASPAATTLIRDTPARRRDGIVLRTAPNTNVLFPRAVVPTLIDTHPPGTHWLACAVAGWPASADPGAAPLTHETPGPTCGVTDDGVIVLDEDGQELLRIREPGASPGEPADRK